MVVLRGKWLFLMSKVPLYPGRRHSWWRGTGAFLMSEVPLFLMSEVPLFLMSEVPLFLMSEVTLFIVSEVPMYPGRRLFWWRGTGLYLGSCGGPRGGGYFL